ncbi:hypothetical protein [Poseidonibacter ostreae]|uniref:Uncharacterized protein n=1 Tax=Poseidonibacter ostreae TaxID=2654171 RepID=A0A6L4WV46_9BACT|nr:hypothetical protein [Poseidonibacter ostreae]KAB7890321.1 hypothetical protein GBG19_03595 [Poseidonibacter ostreae]
MFNKTYKEISAFILAVETIESLDKLLDYIKSDFYASIKLLISVSSTFSIFWKVVLPFIVSFSALLLLTNIKPVSQLVNSILGINYFFGILVCLLAFSLVYILNCKKYFIKCIEESKRLIEKNK